MSLLFLAVQTVHTAGINWASVVTITGSIVLIMTTVFSVLSRYVANRVTNSINEFRIDVIAKLEERITTVENAVVTGRRHRL